MAQSEHDFEALAEVFGALAHPARLQILMQTVEGEFCVQDLGDQLDRSQPNISQHLKVLRECGLVVGERQGKKVCYQPASEHTAELIELGAHLIEDVSS